jgi:hypothetical protein
VDGLADVVVAGEGWLPHTADIAAFAALAKARRLDTGASSHRR